MVSRSNFYDFGALVFAECANRFERSNGIVDYAEGMLSENLLI